MYSVPCRLTMVAVCTMIALVSSQITFSRDWSGGKRASPELALDCGQFTRLCKQFVHELKQIMSSDMASKHHREDLEKPAYDDE